MFENYLLCLVVTDSLSDQKFLSFFSVISTEEVKKFKVETIVNS